MLTRSICEHKWEYGVCQLKNDTNRKEYVVETYEAINAHYWWKFTVKLQKDNVIYQTSKKEKNDPNWTIVTERYNHDCF